MAEIRQLNAGFWTFLQALYLVSQAFSSDLQVLDSLRQASGGQKQVLNSLRAGTHTIFAEILDD